MNTIFDWITVALFAGLSVLFLQRSVKDEPTDRMITYLPAAIGCAISNWLGNEGYVIIAIALYVAIMGYIFYVLKPFPNQP